MSIDLGGGLLAKLAALCAAIDEGVMVNPVCRSCPVAARQAGCGYLSARTPCQHPRQREAWLAAEEWDKRRQSQELCDWENAVELDASETP